MSTLCPQPRCPETVHSRAYRQSGSAGPGDGCSVDRLAIVETLLAARGGLLRRDELLESGPVSESWVRRHLRVGHLQEPFPGIVAVGTNPLSDAQRMAAAVLFAGSDAVVSHESALVLWQLGQTRESVVHVAVPTGSTRRSATGLVVHQRHSTAVAFRCGIPVVPPAEALRAVATVWPLDRQRFSVMEAMRLQLLRPADLLDGAPRRGLGALRLLYEEAAAGAVSGGEAKYWRILKDAGLPLPELNVPVVAQGHRYVLDGCWGDIGLAAEIDGRSVHALPAAFEADRIRQNHLHTSGIVVIRFTVRQVMATPSDVVAQTRAALAAVGRRSDANPLLIKPQRDRSRGRPRRSA